MHLFYKYSFLLITVGSDIYAHSVNFKFFTLKVLVYEIEYLDIDVYPVLNFSHLQRKLLQVFVINYTSSVLFMKFVKRFRWVACILLFHNLSGNFAGKKEVLIILQEFHTLKSLTSILVSALSMLQISTKVCICLHFVDI